MAVHEIIFFVFGSVFGIIIGIVVGNRGSKDE